MSFVRLWSAAAAPLLRASSVVVVCLSAAPAAAQDASPQPSAYDEPPPAHLWVVDGAVTIQREGVEEPAQSGVPLVPGDQLRTARGRAEAIFPDGTAFALDEFTTVDVQSTALLRLTTGRVLVTVARADAASGGARYQIDTPAGSAVLDGPGEYVVGLLGTPSQPQVELAVRRGRGELVTEAGAMPLRSGERSLAWSDAPPSAPQPFNSARMDALDRWAAIQRDARTGSRSATYLPPDLRPYSGAFDRYGAWQYDAAYGNVWYPTVAPGWRPYYNGYWTSVPRYGWTWIGLDRWAWPTHHYGRWGYARSRWFWIPGRRWAPAWVAWGAAPGYVGWSPLGFDNRPVFGLSVSFGSAWGGGWVVLPRAQFGARGYYVPQYAVSSRTLSPRTPFVVQSVPPVAPRHTPPARIGAGRPPAPDFGRRAPSNAGAGRTPGGVAVPRNPSQDRTLGPGGPVGGVGAPPAARGSIDGGGTPGRARTPEAVRRGGAPDSTAPGVSPGVPRRSPPRQSFTPFGDFRGDARGGDPATAPPGDARGGFVGGPSAVRRGTADDGAQPPAATGGTEAPGVRPRSPGRVQGWPGQPAAAPGSPAAPPEAPRPGGRPDAARDGGGWAVRREPGGRVYSPPPVSTPSFAAPDRGGPAERGGPRNLRPGGGAPGGAVPRGGDARAGGGGRERGGDAGGGAPAGGGRTGNAGARRSPR
jgi:hypothetical protein